MHSHVVGHLPGQKPTGDAHASIQMPLIYAFGEDGEREHGRVPPVHGIRKSKPRHERLGDPLARVTSCSNFFRLDAEELAVSARNVARACNVAQDEDVLRAVHDRLEVAGVVPLDRLDLRVGRNLHVCEQG